MSISSISQYIALRNHEDAEISKKVYSLKTSEDVINKILSDHNELRFDLAKNKKLPEKTLRVLASNESSTIRSLIAMKRKLPNELFFTLAKDQSDMVRRSLAYNKASPREVLELLKADTEQDIREVAFERMAILDQT